MTHIASRLAIHEACHAVADFLLGNEIHSIEIGETEGIVRSVPTDDSFNAVVALLAPHALEDGLGFERSGDDFDDREADRILRKHVSAAALPQALAVLQEAADALVLSGPFDTLRRALSKHLGPGTYMTGQQAEEILLAALEQHSALMAPVKRRVERHSSYEPRYAPWYEVADRATKRLLYKGADLHEAERIHHATPDSVLVGSLYG